MDSEGVFTDIFPAEWAADSDFCEYLQELSGYPLATLKKEPERLAEAREENQMQTQELAFKNYKTFIQTADCTRDVFSEFSTVEGRLENLLEHLPGAIDNCNAFHDKVSTISHDRKMNNLTKSRYTELLELLEVPQLVDTTVRNGYYEEALELIEFIRKLERKFSHIKIIADIVRAVKASSHLLLNHLLSQLKTNVQLPACLRIISYLRRMNCFSEAELRIKFLQARDFWLQTNLKAIPDNEPHTHITKTIEACRVHMFDIITQYRAIFSDDESGEESQSLLFHSWVVRKVNKFLEVLKTDLDRGCAQHLEAILAQSMYFGLSFSRVGADFRPLLMPIFMNAAEKYFDDQISKAEQDFLHYMAHFQISESVSLFSTPISSGGIGVSLQPPTSLLEFIPLAVLANGCQTAFTNLRLCCPIALAPKVKSRLTRMANLVIERIIQLYRAEAVSFTSREKESFTKLCSTIISEFLPFVNTCLSNLFPSATLASSLGIPVRESVEIYSLDVNKICEKLKQHVPTEEDDIREKTEDQSDSPSEKVVENGDYSHKEDQITTQSNEENKKAENPVEPEFQAEVKPEETEDTTPETNEPASQKPEDTEKSHEEEIVPEVSENNPENAESVSVPEPETEEIENKE